LWRLNEQILSWLHFVAFVVFFFQSLLTYLAQSWAREYAVDIGSSSVSVQNLISTYFVIVSCHHLLMQHDVVFKSYKESLQKEINSYRWTEYAVSSTIMVVVMGILCDIKQPIMLATLFVNMVAVILCGLWAEKDKKSWFPHLCGWVLFGHLWAQYSYEVFSNNWRST
jgi:L-asparagine transporter-like permease